jgi:hypothetical protein
MTTKVIVSVNGHYARKVIVGNKEFIVNGADSPSGPMEHTFDHGYAGDIIVVGPEYASVPTPTDEQSKLAEDVSKAADQQ